MLRVNHVFVSTSPGSTLDAAGTSKTSSNVSPSFSNFGGMGNIVSIGFASLFISFKPGAGLVSSLTRRGLLLDIKILNKNNNTAALHCQKKERRTLKAIKCDMCQGFVLS
jgi:hypothetical protein